jgi:D-alanyl-D-alanine carboxypeptidase (penicillin-binding protein 5/6)
MLRILSLLISFFLILSASGAKALSYESQAKFAVLMDANTGEVLYEKQAHASMVPSSMTKLMTLYILFDQLKNKRVTLQTPVTISEKAWRTGGSKTFIALGSQVTIEDLMRGIVIQSGNDATVAIAEALAGSEEIFSQHMNETAKKLGMQNSHFKNSSGLPEEGHVSTAYDLAVLSHHLIHDFPEYHHYFSETEFTYHGIRQHNRNPLLGGNLGVDGLKTGHTEEAGYGIVLSAQKDGRSLVATINGLSSQAARAQEAERILTFGFTNFKNVTLYQKGQAITSVPVWMGEEDKAELVFANDVTLLLPIYDKSPREISITYNKPLSAPLVPGTVYAALNLSFSNNRTETVPLTVAKPMEKAGFFRRAWHKISAF